MTDTSSRKDDHIRIVEAEDVGTATFVTESATVSDLRSCEVPVAGRTRVYLRGRRVAEPSEC